MKTVIAILTAIALLGLGVDAQADVFKLGPGLTSLETVTVGDPGNAASNSTFTGPYGEIFSNSPVGAVSYIYNIGKYEVTNAQYCDFLNHKAKSDPYGLYNPLMSISRFGTDCNYTYSVAAGWANKPVNYVCLWDTYRFVNWLSNGQADGDTDSGTYTVNGMPRTYETSITRNANSKWAVASEDEWYKAAYYKGGGANAGYWTYPTQSDTIDTTAANYDGSSGATTTVGSYSYPSAYGTFDQGGNVWEWNDTLRGPSGYRAVHGGCYGSGEEYLRVSTRYDYDHGGVKYNIIGHTNAEDEYLGFRVAQAVPEPSSILALLTGLAGVGFIKRRKK